jgi:hypothetical protein
MDKGGPMSQETQSNPTRVLADIAISNRDSKRLIEAQTAVLAEQTKLLKRIRVCAEIWALIGVIWIIGFVLSLGAMCLFGSGIFAALGSYAR